MISIRVISHDGQAPAQPLAAEFDQQGGTIGRADTNGLKLPGKRVSRLQARIEWRNGLFELVNVGDSPLDVSGRNLSKGSATPIRTGDRIAVGGYVLEVTGGLSHADEHGRPGAAQASAAKADDLLALFGVSEQPGASQAAQASASVTDRSARRPEAAGFTRPPGPRVAEQFDPFAEPAAPADPLPETRDDLDLGSSGSASGQDIDALFGLGAGARQDAADPFADSALAPPRAGVDAGGASLDPLAAFADAPAPDPVPAPIHDNALEIHGAYIPPVARLPDNAIVSWQPGPESREVSGSVAGSREQARVASAPPGVEGRPEPRSTDTPLPQSPLRDAPVEARAARATEQVELPPVHDKDALVRALLDGLGVPDLALPQGLTPEAMERIGQLLREATQGTLDLLLARATIKQEVRAAMTIIVGSRNPLKLSPNVDVALAHLMSQPKRGFMLPVEAMRDAFDDLRAHQLGFMAGTRAALGGVLQRFVPAKLEQRLDTRSVLDSLLPMNRRARLWDLYCEMYNEIAGEAEDDFHTLFGREFLNAYEAQVARLRERE